MADAGRRRYPVGLLANLNRCEAVVRATGAEFAVPTSAPSPKRPVLLDRERMMPSRKGSALFVSPNFCWGASQIPGPVPERSILI